MFNKICKKEDLAKDLSSNIGFPLNFSKKIINDLTEIFVENIKDGELIIKNIGTFKVVHKKERLGRNPKTKEPFIITSRRSIIFTASKKLKKNLINND